MSNPAFEAALAAETAGRLFDSEGRRVARMEIGGHHSAGRMTPAGWANGAYEAGETRFVTEDGRLIEPGEWLVRLAEGWPSVEWRVAPCGSYIRGEQSATSDWLPGQLAGEVYVAEWDAEASWLAAERQRAEEARRVAAKQAKAANATAFASPFAALAALKGAS